MRRSKLTILLAIGGATLLFLALTTTGIGQGGTPAAGQRGAQAPALPGAPAAGAAGGQGRGGGNRGGGQGRGGGNAAPAQPTPRWPDGKPMMGSVPGQPTGRWSGGPTRMAARDLDQVPFQPWAKAVFQQRQIDQFEPHTRCHASGASRQFSTPYGTELLEMRDLQRIYIMDEGGPHSYRIIYMDGRQHPAKLIPSNYGHSIGHWEGDTLVVDTVGYNEKFWMDTAGTPHTAQLHFVERFTRSDFNTLQYQATIEDSGAYTAPWTTAMFTMRWTANSDLFEYICQDNNHGPELMIGSQESEDRSRQFVP